MSSQDQPDYSVDLTGRGSELLKETLRTGVVHLHVSDDCETYPAIHYRRAIIPIPQSNTS